VICCYYPHQGKNKKDQANTEWSKFHSANLMYITNFLISTSSYHEKNQLTLPLTFSHWVTAQNLQIL
jgi:hypothetical protein